MKNKFLCLLRYLLKINRSFIYLFFFFCNLAVIPVFGKEYINCNNIDVIESFVSNDYKSEKIKEGRNIINGKTIENIGEVNDKYINYINYPYDENNIDYLFQPLRINNDNDKIKGTFLTCGVEIEEDNNSNDGEIGDSKNDGDENNKLGMIVCDFERLISEDGKTCQKEFNKKDGEKILNVQIIDCETYKDYTGRDKTIAGNNIVYDSKNIDKSCYPENHICNKYKNAVSNIYYSIVKKENNKFYIFEKKIIKENINQDGKELRQNCNFEVFPCDYKIKNEKTKFNSTDFVDDGYINIVFDNSNDLNNRKFINNIFGNLGDNAFFINPDNTKINSFKITDIKKNDCGKDKYKTETDRYRSCNLKCNKKDFKSKEYSDCKKNCKKEYNDNYKELCKNDFIMRSPYYFKYVIYNDTIKDVYYFIKNINRETFGKVCNGYLPNCKYIYKDDTIEALYDNTTIKINNKTMVNGTNNINSRVTLYSMNNDVKEEYLWYISEQNISDKKCLSVISDSDNITDYDIGYCSDLTDDGSALKYPNGLVSGYINVANCNSENANCDSEDENCNSKNTVCCNLEDANCIKDEEYDKKFKFKAPNCYLKSCADLSPEELGKIISIGDKNAKYCSEYYWLEDQYGMKYFPKEKPVYCSDLENVYIKEDNEGKISVISKNEYDIVEKNNNGNKIVKKIISQLKFRDKDFKIEKYNHYNKKRDCKLAEKDLRDAYGNIMKDDDGNSLKYIDYDCFGAPYEERYYSYGGGINKHRNNCYFKSCFSMTAEERDRVVNANMLNISKELKNAKEETDIAKDKCSKETDLTNTTLVNCTKELEKYNKYISCKNDNETNKKNKNCKSDYPYDSSLMDCNDDVCNCNTKEINDIEAKKCLEKPYMSKRIDLNFFNKENLPIYCDDTFMLSSRFDNDKTKFNDLNLNIIPCSELEKIIGYNISKNNILDSNNLIGDYDTNGSHILCRNNYSSSFNNDMISDNILKEDKGSILNSVFSYSEEDLKNSYKSTPLNYTFSNSEYYIKIKYNRSNYGPEVDTLEIGKYKSVCQNLDNNILYYNARIPGINLNGGLDTDYFDKDLVSNIMLLNTDKKLFLEEYIYKCKNYKSKYNELSTNIIDCGLYYDFDESGVVKSLNNDIISTMDNEVKNFLKAVCILEIENRKPDDREVLVSTIDSSRGALRSDEYNWLLKPIPLKGNYDKRKIIEYRNSQLEDEEKKYTQPSIIDKEFNGCAFFENYDDGDVNNVVGAKMADAIPLNKTNYILKTNFSDPLQRREKGAECAEFEPYCENNIIKQNIIPTSLDQNMEKCQDGFDNKGEPKMDNCTVTVCARYPESVTKSSLNICGTRERSKYRDKCLSIPIKGDKSERTALLSENNDKKLPSSFLYFMKRSDRLRTKIIDDKILVFRDAIVDYNSSSNVAGTPHFEDKLKKKCGTPATEEEIKNNPEKVYEGLCLEKDFYFPEGDTQKSSDYWTKANAIGLETELYNIRNKKFIYFDADQYYQRHIAAKGSVYGSLGAIYISGCGFVAAGCAIANFFNSDLPDKNQCYHTCISEALYQTTDLTVKDYRDKFIYYMNSSRNHILDYFDITKLPYGATNSNYIPDSGLIVGGNIIDNNNYLYRYYPRYDTIERDIKSKMESNINVNGERFYHNTVLARDIIRACKLERFVGDRDVNKFDKNGRQHKTGEMNYYESANYEFIYYKLDKDGNQIDECWEDNIENCLDPEILRCLKSYDVSFIKHNFVNDGVSDDFIMRKGRHLKKYNDCDNLEIFSSCSRDSGEYNQYIPTNIVAYTGNKYSNEELKTNNNCKLDEYGKPLGDLSRCRGFEDDTNGNKLFYTETQSVPVPLYTHPFLFYTLITPKNTPELFDPTFILSQYYKFSDYYQNGKVLGNPKDIERVNDIITDFFYPAFRFNYDFMNGTNDSDYNNKFQAKNSFISKIKVSEKRSYPYIVEYSSNNIPVTAPFKYIMDKTYDIDKKGCYTPKVCIYEIAVVDREKNEEAGICAKGIPEYSSVNDNNDGGAKEQIIKLAVNNNEPTECFKIVDNGIGCYERNIPYLDKFILKLDKNSFIYNTPYINVYLIPNDPYKTNFNYITEEAKEDYIMRENEANSIIEIDKSFENNPIEDRVAKRAYSEKQGFGLNFERSYCSQMYFDYYTSLDTIQREEAKRDGKDKALINRLKTKISTINTTIKSECDKENGEEGEYIIDEGVSLRDIASSDEGKKQCEEAKKECIEQCNGDRESNCLKNCAEDYEICNKKYNSNEIISRKTAIVKRYNESYGGFNEICVADNDIKNILKVYKSQNPGTTRTTLPKVIAFADKEGRGVKTKCLLNSSSRTNPKCLKAETVYVYCNQNEIGVGECRTPKFDIKSLKWGYIKGINCKELLSDTGINADNIEKIKACYKGGFNYNGNIYTREGEQESICACEVVNKDQSIPEGYFITREMTPREYGLCVNLVTPEICPAIRYYDSSSKYTDDNLILGLTKDEIEERENAGLLKYADYQQHLWRTAERVGGFMQSTIFTPGLEHAEFDSTIFCDVPDEEIREFLEEKKLTDNTINVDKILKEKGDKYNNAKNEYAEKTNYYDRYCIGGTRIINGECNGYWRWSESNLTTAPQAICTVQQDTEGNKLYEYKLVGVGCERYSCEGIAYDDKKGYIGDEEELARNTANVFKYSEIDSYTPIKNQLDFRTYLIAEEQDPITVDKRGMSNGFASWKKVISGDYASLEVAYDCLTGYSPAGLNYSLKNEGNDEDMIIKINSGSKKIDVNYDTSVELLSTPTTRDNFIKYIVGQNNRFNVLKDKFKLENDPTIKVERYPKRKCNQKGEWMTVTDVYNLSLIDQTVLGNNYYYNNYNYKNKISLNDLNYWLKMYDINDRNPYYKNFNRNKEFGGYCERNVCLPIDPENENIYEKEGAYDKSKGSYNRKEEIKNRYHVWKHSGGASWEGAGAPRNDSGEINEIGIGSDVSKNITQIFKEHKENESNIPIKYLKKVEGICRTDYGYYNRYSVFDSKNFDGQLDILRDKFEDYINTGKTVAVDQRESDFGANKDNGARPERVCTSYGVWGPVLNRCFRGCEMLDIFHTNFTDEFSNKIGVNGTKKSGEKWKNYIEDKYFYIENNDIKSTIISDFDYSFDGVMDERFKSFGLDISPDHTESSSLNNKGLSIGDYITGGAKWPRTIVDEKSKIETDLLSNKYGLRYVEVKGSCDSSFNVVDGKDERVRTYVARGRDEAGNIKFPTRKCYEDGSWGQVYEETRCVLKKTCKNFNFTLYDLMLLMQIYDNKDYDNCMDSNNKKCRNDNYNDYYTSGNYLNEIYTNKLINDLNTTLSRTITYGYYPPNTDVMETKSCKNCTDTTIKNCCIYNFDASDNTTGSDALSYIVNKAIEDKGFKSTGADNSSSITGKLICNMTGSIGEKLTGWSIGITDIGDYFVPNVCDEGKTNDPDYIDNIDLLVHHIDSNKKFVPVIYNVNNDTRYSTKSIRGSNIPHYAEETKLHYLYNNITENLIKTKYPKATKIENESKKNVKIGTKFYDSYQMYYRCNEDYFYNYLGAGEGGNLANGKNIPYYHNDIILECKKNGNNSYKFTPNDASIRANDEPRAGEPLHPHNCYVRSCGSNNYHQRWTLSFPKEFFEKFDGTDGIYNYINLVGGKIVSNESYIECPKINAEGNIDNNGTIETAFILNDNLEGDNIKDHIIYYGQNKADAAVYKVKKFATKISANCRNRFESESKDISNNRKTINGMLANTLTGSGRSYDIQKYGELDKNNLPYTFCRDLNKKEDRDCKTFTESQVASGIVPKPADSTVSGNSVFLNNIKKDGGYCVPMACKGKDLKLIFEEGKAKVYEDKNGFNLAKSYYNFGDYVIIESVEGDFVNNSSDNPNRYNIAEVTNRKKVIGGKNDVSLCPTNQDLYNVGKLSPFDFDVYMNKTEISREQQIYINKCFSWLINDSAINDSYDSGYTEITKNSLYVGFNNTTFEEEKKITSVYDAVNNYSLDATKEAEFKKKAAEFIVNNLIFKNGGIERGEYNFGSSIENSLKTDFDDAKRNAVGATDDYFKEYNAEYNIGNNKKITINCYSEETEKENFESVISGNVDENLKKVNYNDIVEDSDKSAILNKYIKITGNTDIDFYIKGNDGEKGFVGFLTKEKESSCKSTIIKKIEFSNVSATSQKYKKIYSCSTGYTYNSTEKKCIKDTERTKSDESAKEDEKIDPEISLDANDYKCFYDIDNTGFGKVSNYCDASEFGINNSNDNCSDKYLINNENEVYSDLSGNEYVVDEGVTSNDGCENRDFVADEELEITGDAILSLEAYIDKYNANYSEEINKLKSKLEDTIANSKSSDIWYKLLEEYFNIYKIENFLNTGNNFEYYKHYISKLEDYDSIVISRGEKKSDGSYDYSINVTTSVVIDEEKNELKIQSYSLDYFSTTNNKINCYEQENNDESTETNELESTETNEPNTCNGSQIIKDKLNNFYKNIFINFFNNSSNLEKIKSFAKEYEKTYENCKKIYSDYINVRKKYNKDVASNKSSFGSGLFMAMKCTPEGWEVLDELTCKSRCSGASSSFRVDPVGDGDWKNVKLNVTNLRFSKIASGLAFGHSRAYCYMGGMGTQHTRHAKVYVKCNENGVLETLSYSASNEEGRFDNESDWWERWKWIFFLGLGCKAHAYYKVYGGNENFYTNCEHTWNLGTGAKLIYCGKASFDDEKEVGAKIWFTN